MKGVLLLIEIFLLTFVVIITVITFATAMEERELAGNNYIKLKFSQFKKFYDIQPNEYELHTFMAWRSKGVGVSLFDTYGTTYGVFIKFNLIDTIRYFIFARFIEKGKNKLAQDSYLKTYLKYVRSDIDSYNKEITKEVELAMKELDSIDGK